MVTRGQVVLVAALALAGCKTGDPPSGFGVNLTVSKAGLGSDVRAQISSTRLLVPDDGGFDVDIEASHFHGATEARFQYVPGVKAGTITLYVVARNAFGVDLAAGGTGPVALVPDRAVTARIELTGCTRTVAVGATCRADCECATNICDGGRCSATAKPLGSACTAAGECESGLCVDGVCCGVASCPICQSCGAGGACAVVRNGPDLGSCDGSNACDATGMCKKANGQSCGDSMECASGACIHGYCCNDPTCAGCRHCDGNGTEGTCTNVPDGTDSHGGCTTAGPNAEGGYFCLAGACATSRACPGGGTLCDNAEQDTASGTADCKKCHYCQDGMCKGKVESGMSCNYNVQCGSSSSCNMGTCGATCVP